ncbi:MAG: hypothetical protein QG656_2175, partial [Candidatus Hydrogenedentes bacterium]|nr:hypothetical protein [Candidatus Hydrogenedentota bacterium]
AGRAIRLQLEAHPGPKNDTTCDQCFWAEPTVTAGTPAPETAEPARQPARTLGTIASGGKDYAVSVALGARGLLDAEVAFQTGDRRLSFAGFPVTVLGDALSGPGSVARLVAVEEREHYANSVRLWHCFESWAGPFEIVTEAWISEGALHVSFGLWNAPPRKPWSAVYMQDISAGPWSAHARRVYASVGNVIEEPEAFSLGFDGHQMATSFVGFDFDNGMSLVQAIDSVPERLEVTPATRRYSLHAPHAQVQTFIPCATVWEGARVWHDVNGLRCASGVDRAAGRFVFDLWGGNYASSADALERAFAYGLTDSMVVWHNWQRWGYDYRLPDIYPPNPDLGTLEDFQRLAETCKQRDVVFAPHDNYIDFYPDAEGYSYKHIAFSQGRTPIRAWLNEGRNAQAFRWRADTVKPFIERNLAMIRKDIAPTGFFIDVWSSIGPYDYWTDDGQFFDRNYTRTQWGEYFAWIRDYLGNNAPQISESGHDQLIGWLDGAQTNHLRVDANPPGEGWTVWRIPCADAERIPWFDAAHHDRFALHGAGYSSRYQGGLDAPMHGIYSDDYIATEVLTGHPAMVEGAFDRNVVRKYWLLHTPMRALARQRIDGVDFDGGNIHRQHVRLSNGGEVWVNRGAVDWSIEDHVLPEYGFYLRIPSDGGVIEAAIECIDGVIADWQRGPDAVYVNARPPLASRAPVRPSVESVRYLGGRACELTIRWDAKGPLDNVYHAFVHGTDAAGVKILVQGDHPLPVPTDQWHGTIRSVSRIEFPEEYAPGTAFPLYVGLYRQSSSERVALDGPDDPQRRIRTGTLTLEGEGNALKDIAWTPYQAPPDPLLARLNVEGKALAFSGITTNGACRIANGAAGMTITALPDGPAFDVRIGLDQLPWTTDAPRTAIALDAAGKETARSEIQTADGVVTLRYEPGVF